MHANLVDATSTWRTLDGGVSWERSYPTLNGTMNYELLFCGEFISSDTGWVGGDHGTVFTTTTGGKTWHAIASESENVTMIDAGMIGKSLGWIIATNGTLFLTLNNGASWAAKPLQVNKGLEYLILSAYFHNQERGWIVGKDISGSDTTTSSDNSGASGVALFTVDGGNSWKKAELGSEETSFLKVEFSDELHGWLASTKNLYITNDGGKTWGNISQQAFR